MRETTAHLLDQAVPIYYNHSERIFSGGIKRFHLRDFSFDLLNPERSEDEDALFSLDELGKRVDSPLVQTWFGPVMLPRMYDWLTDNYSDRLAQETATVMREVIMDFDSEYARNAPVGKDGDFMTFGVHRIRNEHPHLSLSTYGNCACLGVDVDGVFGQTLWGDKVAGYSFHNIDHAEQGISLMAGLGHIAYLAASTESHDGESGTIPRIDE